jgi:hypothetical protein
MEQLTINFTEFLPLLFIIAALAIRYTIGRRRFNRRGIAGLQHFRSYGHSVIITLLERLASWAANILLLLGAVMAIFKYLFQ